MYTIGFRALVWYFKWIQGRIPRGAANEIYRVHISESEGAPLGANKKFAYIYDDARCKGLTSMWKLIQFKLN